MKTTFTPPLSAEDAAVIEHAAEVRILEASMPTSDMDDVERYAHARRWLSELLQGRAVEIDDADLARSRRIIRAVR